MTTETETRSPIDAHVVAIDETHYYNIPEADAPYIERIRGIYFCDRNERTCCCEMTPSHYMIYVYTSVLLTAAGEALSEEKKNRIYNEYELCDGDNIYVHCYRVAGLIERAGRWDHFVYGGTNVAYEDVDYDDQIESLREHLSANPPI